ncbi:MAG: carboxymethylenebutenolidase [Chloroflexota bacterium]|nr:carboxymethylenebutenolidase [Chloroflexota bacterium]
MCFDEDSHPPIPPIAGAAVDGKRITLHSADGTDFGAFAAQPAQPTGAAMLILPDVRGLFTFYEELALRFAEAGVAALAIDYFGRTAGAAPRPVGFDHNPHISQVTWPGLRADIIAARHEIEGWPGVRGVFSVGFCFGGRLSLLLASEEELAMAGVVGFYGWPTGEARGGVPAPIDRVSAGGAPILALFGGADQGLPAEVVESYRGALAGAGAPHQVITYPDAPHSFFDRKADEYAADSADAWKRVLDFVDANTPPQ